MKKTYIISLFVFVVFIGCVYYGSYYYTKHYTKEIPLKEEILSEKTSEIANHTTNQTEYVLETYDASTYELTEEKLTMPAEYVGKTREELIEILKQYENNPTQEDLQKGLHSFSLICFSENKIVLRKTYHENVQEKEYEARVDELGKIVIYQVDTNEIYTETDIVYETLPKEAKEKIEQGEKMYGLKEIFDFLENYSS